MAAMTLSRPAALSGTKGTRRTFLGNWSEDMQAREDELAEYTRARAEGKLLSQQIKAKKRAHESPVQLEPPQPDGFLRLGQLFCLQNGATEGVLSIDLEDELTVPPHRKIAVTTIPAGGAMCRNTFLVEAVPSEDDEMWEANGEADVLHYGQKCRIRFNPELVEAAGQKPLYLHSELVTPSTHSKVSKLQEVSLCDHGNTALDWEVLYANPELRFEMQGQPVKCNSIIVLSHCRTGQYLASHKVTQLNDFGAEYECFAKQMYAIKGKNNQVRPEAPANHWVAVTGIAPDE